VELPIPSSSPPGGVALRREWVADHAQVLAGTAEPDALLLAADEPADLFGLLLAALRLDLPAVARVSDGPFASAMGALGLAPLGEEPADAVAVRLAKGGGPRPGAVVRSFSLANALRAGLSAGAGPELLVHLAAVADEAGETGFGQMMRVLAPESPVLAGAGKMDAASVLASLGDALHDTPTVAGPLKELLPSPDAGTEAAARLSFVRGRASGVEAVSVVLPDADGFSGRCRVFGSEARAVRAVERGRVGEGDVILVLGSGPRGGPGLVRLDLLGEALLGAGLNLPIVTDGLPPARTAASAPSLSLFTPESVAEGVLARLRDGDLLRVVREGALIRTDVRAEDLANRSPLKTTASARRASNTGYAVRYARSARSALEGAGFGEA